MQELWEVITINFLLKRKSKRAETAAVVNRMIKLVNGELGYKVVELNADGSTRVIQEYTNYQTALNNLAANQAIMKGKRFVYIHNGMAVSNSFTIIYNSPTFVGSGRTYVSGGTEFNFIEANKDWVKISLNGTTGYVNSKCKLNSNSSYSGSLSSYERKGDELYHYIYNPLNKDESSLINWKGSCIHGRRAKVL